jgi:hypothetical protein
MCLLPTEEGYAVQRVEAANSGPTSHVQTYGWEENNKPKRTGTSDMDYKSQICDSQGWPRRGA